MLKDMIEGALRVKQIALDPAYKLLPGKMKSDEATVMLLSIIGQESDFRHQSQVGGPAAGLAQFEAGGGIRGVINHSKSSAYARDVCHALGVPFTVDDVYAALKSAGPGMDALDAAFARLLLWTEPDPLPRVSDADTAFFYYVDAWRPGAYWRGTKDKKLELRGKFLRYHGAVLKALNL